MIHDRELIYDAKTQLHQADQDYKNDSPLHYRPGDIHSGSTGAYDAENNEFSTAIAGVEGVNKAIKAFGEGATSIITAVGEKNKQDANVARNKDQTQRNSLSTINTGDFGNKHSWQTDPIDGSNKSNPWLGKGNFGHEDAMRKQKINASTPNSSREVYKYTDYENDMRLGGKTEKEIQSALKTNRDYNINTHGTHTPTEEGLEQNWKMVNGTKYLNISGD
jgi:hypothetical protein